LPGSGWYDAGASVTISAALSSGWAFERWFGSGSGSYSGVASSASIMVNGPITETAYFYTFSIGISPLNGSVALGGSVSTTVTVTLSGGHSSSITVGLGLALRRMSLSLGSASISSSAASASSIMSILTSASTPAGIYRHHDY